MEKINSCEKRNPFSLEDGQDSKDPKQSTADMTVFIGIVSDDELLDLLDLALSSDSSNTVRKARELMRSKIDPMQLISQLANLIMDILAGKCQEGSSEVRRKFFSRHASAVLPPTGSRAPDACDLYRKTGAVPQNTHYIGGNMRDTQFQTIKPSGLRMPSPSLGFFCQVMSAKEMLFCLHRKYTRSLERELLLGELLRKAMVLPNNNIHLQDEAK